MPAVRGKNLRSGDIVEQLGFLLLQNLALVSPVPRTEDVGVDAVVTLLDDFDSYRLIASDTFFVQIKSSTVKEIVYKNEEVEWLFNLELPFFIASVDKNKSSVELYCCHRLSDAFVTNKNRKELIIRFDEELGWDHFVHEDEKNIHVGPPIISWSISDISEKDDLRTIFNSICKEHIKSAKKTLQTRRVGWIENIYWKANELPKVELFKSTCSSEPGEMIEEIFSLMFPYFSMLMDECTRAANDIWPKELLKLLEKKIQVIEMIKNAK